MIIIFDFDYTLFDTVKFRADLTGVLGVSAKKFAESYNKFFKRKKTHYNFESHLEKLVKDGTIRKSEIKAVKKRMFDVLNQINRYLFPEAENILKKFKEKGHALVLITCGDLKWQKAKLNKLKIKKYFSKIIITDGNKARCLGFIKKTRENIIIINDNARESFRMKKILGKGEIFLIKGPHSDNIKHKLNVYSLKGCFNIVKKYEKNNRFSRRQGQAHGRGAA